jgi:mannosyltransferase
MIRRRFSGLTAKYADKAVCMVTLDRPVVVGRGAGPAPRPMRRASLWVGLAAVLVTYAGAGIPSYWGDEAASVLSAQRSWESLAAELSTVDAVHGLYYSLLHVWVDLFGSSEWSTRALSAIGIGFLAAGVVVLGRRWYDTRTAILAGLLVPLIPRAGVLAIEARGYALAAAAAVWVTVLLVHIVDRGSGRAAWVLYATAVAVSGTLFLYLLLMPLVHAAWLLTRRALHGRVARRWVGSMAIAAVLAAPIILAASSQRGQVAFLSHRGYMSMRGWFVTPWFAHPAPAALLLPLLAIGVLVVLRRRRSIPAALPTVAWLLAPAAVLVLLDVFVSPTYNPRYLSISLGAVALLLSSGAWAVVDLARRIDVRGGTLAATALLGIGAVILVPEFVHQRTAFAKDGGADGRAVAAEVAARSDPGDAVLFGTGTRPSRAPRLIYRLYPEAFAGLEDPQLITPADETDGLWDRMDVVADVAPGLGDGTVWLLETGSSGSADDDVAALQRAGFTQVSRTDVHRTIVYEFRKGTS